MLCTVQHKKIQSTCRLDAALTTQFPGSEPPGFVLPVDHRSLHGQCGYLIQVRLIEDKVIRECGLICNQLLSLKLLRSKNYLNSKLYYRPAT